MLKGISCLEFNELNSFPNKPVLNTKNSRSACDHSLVVQPDEQISYNINHVEKLIKNLMTIASVWPSQNHHLAALSSCTKNLFLPEGALVAFLTGFFPSGFHVS